MDTHLFFQTTIEIWERYVHILLRGSHLISLLFDVDDWEYDEIITSHTIMFQFATNGNISGANQPHQFGGHVCFFESGGHVCWWWSSLQSPSSTFLGSLRGRVCMSTALLSSWFDHLFAFMDLWSPSLPHIPVMLAMFFHCFHFFFFASFHG